MDATVLHHLPVGVVGDVDDGDLERLAGGGRPSWPRVSGAVGAQPDPRRVAGDAGILDGQVVVVGAGPQLADDPGDPGGADRAGRSLGDSNRCFTKFGATRSSRALRLRALKASSMRRVNRSSGSVRFSLPSRALGEAGEGAPKERCPAKGPPAGCCRLHRRQPPGWPEDGPDARVVDGLERTQERGKTVCSTTTPPALVCRVTQQAKAARSGSDRPLKQPTSRTRWCCS